MKGRCQWAHGIKLTMCSLAFGVLFGAGNAGGAPTGMMPPEPTLSVTIGGESFSTEDATWNYDPAQNLFTLAEPLAFTNSNGGTFFILDADAQPDPGLAFTVLAINSSSAPVPYSFTFNVPLNPTLFGPINSQAQLDVVLIDTFTDGATVQPAGGSLLTSYDFLSDGSAISKNVDIGSLFSIPSGISGTTFTANGSLTCGQPCVTMSAVLSFTLSPQDIAGFKGEVVQVVPLPAALWLFASGVIGLAGFARRQRVSG